jgi:hypothetical protein
MIDEITRMRSFRDDVSPPGEESVRQAHAALAEVIGGDRRGRARTGERRAARARVWTLRVSFVAAAPVITVVLASVLGSGSPTAPSTAAAAVLERLAGVAAAQRPVGAPGPGQYLYVDSTQANQNQAPEIGCTALVPEHRQVWIGADGSGRLLESFGRPSFSSAQDRARYMHAGLAGAGAQGSSDARFAPRCLTIGPTNLQALPTATFRLRRELQLRKIEAGPPGLAEDFVQVGDLLRETDAPPALYRVAATIPGVQLLGLVRDHAGRPGIGLAFTHPGGRSELIFDPSTSALLGEQDSAAGTLTQWAVYRRSIIVDHIPGRAPAALRPACHPVGAGKVRQTLSGVTLVTGRAHGRVQYAPDQSSAGATQSLNPQGRLWMSCRRSSRR